MKKVIIFLCLSVMLFAFENQKIESLMGKQEFQTYNKLLNQLFPKKDYTIKEILNILKNNGLLELFFNSPKIIDTKFIFENGNPILNSKILNDSLKSLGYYYFYPKSTQKIGNKLILNIEFKSEHYINPVSFIDEISSRGCKVLNVSKNQNYIYDISCNNEIIKEAYKLSDKNEMYINTAGVYWVENSDFSQISLKTKRIDYWHPSIWFYDDKLNLLNNIKINKKTTNITLNIPASCKYIKITDIYSGENFKRGIIIKGLK